MSDTCNKSDIGNTEATSPDTPLENAFCTKTWYTDLALTVEEDTLYVSKHVLAIVSPVFEAMFSGDYEENSKGELSLPEKKYVDVLEFLQCIYPNLMKPVTLENVYAVLPLADEYQVAMLKVACESCLLTCLTDDISSDQLYDILTKANTFNLSCVMEKCIDKAADRPYTEINNADNTVALAEDIKIKIKDRMLQNLSIKCNNMSQLIDTSKALCTFLGAGAKQKNLVNQYIEGCVVGDWKSFRVSSPYADAADLNIDDNLFIVHVGTCKRDHYSNMITSFDGYGKTSLNVFIQCSFQKHDSVNCFGAVVVKNWMKKKDDIIKFGKHQFDTLQKEWKLWECVSGTLEDETAGFIYEGTINIDVFLFKMG